MGRCWKVTFSLALLQFNPVIINTYSKYLVKVSQCIFNSIVWSHSFIHPQRQLFSSIPRDNYFHPSPGTIIFLHPQRQLYFSIPRDNMTVWSFPSPLTALGSSFSTISLARSNAMMVFGGKYENFHRWTVTRKSFLCLKNGFFNQAAQNSRTSKFTIIGVHNR